MRLICPNCSAQYEIEDGLIPDEGRDVQCSNCGNTWFEVPKSETQASDIDVAIEDTEPEPEDLDDLVAGSDGEMPVSDDWDEPGPAKSEPEPVQADDDAEDDDWPATRPAAPAAPVSPRVVRRPADVAALDVLKEEAERELAQRKADAAPMESQSDLGLDQAAPKETPSRALRARMARLRGEDDSKPKSEEQDYQAPRRELLPDIEEINSSLNPASGKRARAPADPIAQRRGFRAGFLLSVGVAAGAVILYAWAPAIASVLPGSEQSLISYVDWVNSVRDAF